MPDDTNTTENSTDNLKESIQTQESSIEQQQTSPVTQSATMTESSKTLQNSTTPTLQQNPPVSSSAPNNDEDAASSATTYVLQWMTYAFWGWMILALGFLVFSFIFNIIAGFDSSMLSLYSFASLLILFPAALVTDHFYAKREPDTKKGPAVAIMIIHAVIFALCGIALLITAVFSLVSIATSGAEAIDNALATIISSFIMAVVYAAMIMRTLKPANLPKIRKIFIIFISIVSAISLVGAIAGPIYNQVKSRDDRLIEEGLYSVSNSVEDYIRSNNKYPEALSEVTANGDGQTLINKGLITFESGITSYGTLNSYSTRTSVPTTYPYKLCVTYKAKKGNGTTPTSNYLNTHNHPAGYTCYSRSVTVYKSSSLINY